MTKIFNFWAPKVEIVMTFWNYYHKLLNSNFIIPGSLGATQLIFTSQSGPEYLKSIKSMLIDGKVMNISNDSFNIFVLLLSSTIDKLKLLDGSKQINKILGRIYSNLPQSKLIALNERGIRNVGMMFLVFCLKMDVAEIGQRIADILLMINIEKLAEGRSATIATIHIALMLLFIENRISIEGYVTKFMAQLNNLLIVDRTNCKGSFSIMKVLVSSFSAFFLQNNLDLEFNFGEHLLFGNYTHDTCIQIYIICT